MAAARDALMLTQAGYDAGISGYVQLLVADVQYHQARLAWLRAVAQRLQDDDPSHRHGWNDSRRRQ